MACVNFPSGYFQLRLDKESQGLTVFNTEFGRYLFLRAPQGLSSSGDAFNANTDRFYSGIGKYLLKQVELLQNSYPVPKDPVNMMFYSFVHAYALFFYNAHIRIDFW